MDVVGAGGRFGEVSHLRYLNLLLVGRRHGFPNHEELDSAASPARLDMILRIIESCLVGRNWLGIAT